MTFHEINDHLTHRRSSDDDRSVDGTGAHCEHPGTCGGRPRIDGHSIKVDHIVVCYERMGMSPDAIVTELPTITLARVHAALACYYEHQQEIDANIEEVSGSPSR